MPRHLKFYGAGYVLLLASLIFALLYLGYECRVVADEAISHGQQYDVRECHNRFWAGVWENDQSEMLQLAVEFFFLGGLAAYIGRSMEAVSYRSEQLLNWIVTEMGGHPEEIIPEDWKE